jgi:hypothetical protein
VIEQFEKKNKEAKTVAKEENKKRKEKMTEVENEIPVSYIDVIAVQPRHKYNAF